MKSTENQGILGHQLPMPVKKYQIKKRGAFPSTPLRLLPQPVLVAKVVVEGIAGIGIKRRGPRICRNPCAYDSSRTVPHENQYARSRSGLGHGITGPFGPTLGVGSCLINWIFAVVVSRRIDGRIENDVW